MSPEAGLAARLSVESLGFAYDGGPAVLKDVSFSLDPGEVVSILGPNGSGKTTLLHCMAGLQRPKAGTIRVGGVDASALEGDRLARAVGFVPQSQSAAFDYSVLEYVVTGRAPWMGLFKKPGPAEYEIAERALETLEIRRLADKPVTKLSGGERQQVGIARALAQRSGILLLDEPTAHLDYGNQIKVLRIIKDLAQRGYAVAMTTHDPGHAIMLGGSVAALGREGAFSFGRACDVVTGDFLSGLYGVGIEVRRIDDLGRSVCLAHPF